MYLSIILLILLTSLLIIIASICVKGRGLARVWQVVVRDNVLFNKNTFIHFSVKRHDMNRTCAIQMVKQ